MYNTCVEACNHEVRLFCFVLFLNFLSFCSIWALVILFIFCKDLEFLPYCAGKSGGSSFGRRFNAIIRFLFLSALKLMEEGCLLFLFYFLSLPELGDSISK